MWTAASLLFGKVASNPALRKIAYIIGVTLAACLGIYLVREQAKGEQRDKDKAREVKATQTTLTKIEEKSDAIIAQADAIRAANPVTGNPDRMSDPSTVPRYQYRD